MTDDCPVNSLILNQKLSIYFIKMKPNLIKQLNLSDAIVCKMFILRLKMFFRESIF